jgi:hypothetical protein
LTNSADQVCATKIVLNLETNSVDCAAGSRVNTEADGCRVRDVVASCQNDVGVAVCTKTNIPVAAIVITRLSSISLEKLTNAHTSAASFATLLRQSKQQAG